MTIGRIIGFHAAAVLVGLLTVCVAALWGLNGLRHDYNLALRGYAQLRDAYEVGAKVETARALLSGPGRDTSGALRELRAAVMRIEASGRGREPDDAPLPEISVLIGRAEHHLSNGGAEGPVLARADLNRVLSRLGELSVSVRRDVETQQTTAEAKRDTAMVIVGAVCAGGMVCVALLAVVQYRAVTRPLGRLSRAARELASGRFDGRIAPRAGPRELVDLAGEFDRMADELRTLYQNLEEKVQTTSAQLVRAERLAQMGHLAAGVAHEINNPLGIIAGHAELALRESSAPGAALHTGARDALRVIVDESFRCKQIVEQLLMLARRAAGRRERVELSALVGQVVLVVCGAGRFQGRQVIFEKGHDSTGVVVDPAEFKQVVMNLIVNALEATRDIGRVRAEVSSDGPRVRLVVSDDGQGIHPDTIGSVFEPFVTDSRGKASRLEAEPESLHRGTGLGLSITRVIVHDHGGELTAHSDGLEKGSRFVVDLPRATSPEG